MSRGWMGWVVLAAASVAQVPNREPLAPVPFLRLPIGSVAPRGWLRNQLELEAAGMTGRLEEISAWCRFEGNAWASPTGEGHSGWEELPYWLKGFGDLGYVLGDERMVRRARRWIDAVLASQREDGWFGPKSNRTSLGGHPDLWPHMVMLNVLQSFHEAGGDERVLPFMLRWFRWLDARPPEDFGRGYWPKLRAGDLIETAHWLYNRTGEAFLLGVGKKIHDHMARWRDGVIDWHNVNIAQGFREPAVYWVQDRRAELLAAAERNYREVMDRYGHLPGGGFAGDENCRPGFGDPRQGFETCGIVEFMHSFEMLLRITGDPAWADRCEELAFNLLPSALTADLKALRYLNAANGIVADRADHAPGIQNRGTMLSFSPLEVFRCCQHNVSHGWPYFAEELWLATAGGGLAAAHYAAGEVKATVAGGKVVTIAEETDYPFDDTVALRLALEGEARFPLALRIPGWCAAPALAVNGMPVPASEVPAKPGTFATLDRTWKDGDTVTLRLPMAVTVRTWPRNHGAVSVHRGPLVFALRVGEKWTRYGGTAAWPELEAHATTPWNYGLVLDAADPASSFAVETLPDTKPRQVFTPEAVPVRLRAQARRIPAWTLDHHGLVATLQPSPVRSAEPVEQIELIPMGAARLRISAFPRIGDGPDARVWTPPPRPPEVSHCWSGDTPLALVDGLLPKSSGDHDLPRFTWWDHRGTTEWAQLAFDVPATLSEAEVYWFDDGSRGGHCRTPASWRLLWWDGAVWKPVTATSPFGTVKDVFNRVTFEPVTTSRVRLEADLQTGWSAGILELRTGR